MLYKRLSSDQNEQDIIINEMQSNLYDDNTLEDIVEIYDLHKKSNFVKINIAKVDDFP
jgi:hypothetical protein